MDLLPATRFGPAASRRMRIIITTGNIFHQEVWRSTEQRCTLVMRLNLTAATTAEEDYSGSLSGSPADGH
jgi:hypothetical protein